jgi:hypothetical protein
MTLSHQPAHTLRAMARRAADIAAELGPDATRYHRLNCLCLVELQNRKSAEVRHLDLVEVQS